MRAADHRFDAFAIDEAVHCMALLLVAVDVERGSYAAAGRHQIGTP